MKKIFFFYASISILTGACLCWEWYHHHIRPLSSIATLLTVFDPEQKTVEVHVKALSAEECKKLLGHNLPGKGVQPLFPHNPGCCRPKTYRCKKGRPKNQKFRVSPIYCFQSIGIYILAFYDSWGYRYDSHFSYI